MKSLVRNLTILFVMILITGCNKNNPVQTNQDNSNYFPNTDNTNFKYSINISGSQSTIETGTKSTIYSGTSPKGNTTYQRQLDTTFTGSLVSSTNISYFRKDGSGVFYFFDTTGISGFIPSQYMAALSISTDLHILYSPLSDGLNWQVYKLGVVSLNYNFIDIEASYLGKEDVTLNLPSGQVTVSAAKIKYVMTLQFPNPQNLLLTLKSTLTAYGWFASDIGHVQWEGSSVVLNGFSGGGINIADTSNTITQKLINYNVK